MSAYAIVGQKAAQAVDACLRQRGQGEAPVRIAEGGKGALALEEAAQAPADLLLLDVETGPGLGPAVLCYRLARPCTRIILLASGRVPGDLEVAAGSAGWGVRRGDRRGEAGSCDETPTSGPCLRSAMARPFLGLWGLPVGATAGA